MRARLWFSDWGRQEVIAVDLDGNSEVILRGTSFPLCVDWLPDGHLPVVSARDGLLLRREHDGSLVAYGDLKTASDPPAINELVVDGCGNAYVNGGGFNMMAGEEFAPGVIALVAPDGSARQVADGLAFPNGMLVLPDSSTLIVAESYARRLTAFDIDSDGGLSNRRVWADLGDGVPDSIRSRRCLAQGHPYRQCHEPLCFGRVIIDWHYRKNEPALSQAHLFDENRVPGIG